jgi:aspartyl-tRNA(Asn)/glutamyl-tRNA(Gln) amidotransferase subunit A
VTATAEAILELSAGKIAEAVRRGEVSAVEVTEAALARIEAAAAGNAFITASPERALRRAARRPTGPLAGVPLAVKDQFDTAGLRTTYGSAVFRDHVPTRTARAVRQLEAAGAIVVGKANQHEFAWGTTSQNPHWGTVANPVRPGRVAGGSSGGNAAALAGRLCAIALGTDTGGSVRIPAACCDVVGFKPPFGVVSTGGTFPLAPSFDTVGPMARSVRDCAVVYAVLSGREIPNPTLSGIRVGVLAPAEIEDALADLGALVQEVTLPVPAGDPAVVFHAECAITHAAWFPAQRELYGPDLQVKLDDALRVSTADHERGRRALLEFRAMACTQLAVDVILSPTIAIEPPPVDCWEPDVRLDLVRYTRPFNFLGWPAIAIGNVQIAGRDDATVLGVALVVDEICREASTRALGQGPEGRDSAAPRESG